MRSTRASESFLWQSGEFDAIAIVVTATTWSANNLAELGLTLFLTSNGEPNDNSPTNWVAFLCVYI